MPRNFQALLLACAVSSAYAQVTTATLYGSVYDPTGSVVPQATVRVINISTAAALSATTNELGVFTIPFLVPGRYSVFVEAAGFKPVERRDLQLDAGQRLQISFTLELGTAAERVLVTAEAPLVNSVNAEQSAHLISVQVSELPLARRDWTALLRLAPGVALGGNNDVGVTMNGLPPRDFA